jgi:diapolycopene oxygenase
MAMTSHVVVVGAGLGGLAAGVTAAARGHRVTVLDKNPWLGGKAAVLNLPDPERPGSNQGFRFDMGPTILTVPRVLRRIYAEAGRDQAQDLPLIRLDPQWRCFFDDQTRIDLIENVDAMARSMDAFAPGTG